MKKILGMILSFLLMFAFLAEPAVAKNHETVSGNLNVSLQYDDRYSIQTIANDYVIAEIKNQNVTSRKVSNGTVSNEPDEAVLTQISDTEVRATGTGTATIVLRKKLQSILNNESSVEVKVTVEASPLTLIYLLGQSNMEGFYDYWADGNTQRGVSVACPEGAVYSTYLPTVDSWATKITGISFANMCNEGNVADFVAGSLQGNTSISGKTMEYPLDSLDTAGNGKTGPDSGIAYTWNRLSGDKVWVVNAAWSGSYMDSWVPGRTLYTRALNAAKTVEQTCRAELDAGHYTRGKKLIFWQQGEYDQKLSSEEYVEQFGSMHDEMNKVLHPDAWGIITVRLLDENGMEDNALYMEGPRAAQYGMNISKKYSDTYVVSNVNEQWVTDSGVQQYFKSVYPNDKLDYPIHNSSADTSLPTRASQIYGVWHYYQIGHNENGITAAEGMYKTLTGENLSKTDVRFLNEQGEEVSSLMLHNGESRTLVAVTDPVYCTKKMSVSVIGNAATYNELDGKVTGEHIGNAMLQMRNEYGLMIAQIPLTVLDANDFTKEAGSDYTGIYDDHGTLHYLKNGWQQDTYTGLINDRVGWWYVKNGIVDTSYTGFMSNANGWWYVEKGKITFKRNDIVFGTVNGINGWWHVRNSQVVYDTTVANNANGWWYVQNGKVNFDYTGVANNQNGWWRIEKGQVNFNYNGLANNQNGWWKIKNGQVDFGYTGITNNENGWWRIENGQVNFAYNGIANNENGWWKFHQGKVDFGFNGIAQNENGAWYLEGGKVNFSYSGWIRYHNAWRAIYQGRVIV